MLAWHFVGATLRDGSPVPPDGKTLVFHGDPILCEQGFHWSLSPFEALQYAPGETLCLVKPGGTIIHGKDKGVSSRRTIIARMDATNLLRYFARQQALSVVHLLEPPEIVLDFLMGDDAARDAARAAAGGAAWDAAWDAAWAAAWAAAGDAARAAAWDAARAAAGDAAGDAARAAAWDAAWAAARDAARGAAKQEFDLLVAECFADFL